MKMKKLVALGAAAAMSMAMCVNVLAEITVSSENTNFGSYTGGVAKLANTGMIDATHQWTVVLIDAEKKNSTLGAEDLYYINQGTSADGFWVTDGMGTKIDLTTLVNETTTEKNFIIRIGGETITEATGIIEVPFKITYGAGTLNYKLGDIDGDDYIGSPDALIALQEELGMNPTPLTDAQMLAADVDGDDYIGSPDALEMLLCELGMSTIIFN